MAKIKILEVVPSLQFGGVEQFLYNYLSHMDLTEFEIHILTQEPRFSESEKRFKDLGVKIYSVPPKRKNLIKHFRSARRIMKRERYDIVHCHLSVKSFWFLALAKRAKVPVRIYHAHEVKAGKCLRRLKWKAYGALSRRFSTALFACGKDAAEFCFGKNRKYVFIPNAILPERFKFNRKRRAEVRAELGIRDDEILLGEIARFVPEKNQRFLVEVFDQICDQQTDFKLLLVGDGPLKTAIRSEADARGLSKQIVYVDSTNTPEDYYSAMDVFLICSLSEGFPVTAVEAQCAGLMVILSDRVTREAKLTEDCWFVGLDQRAWVRRIMKTKEMLVKQGTRTTGYGQVVASKLNIENSAGELLKQYEMLYDTIRRK